MVSNIKDKFKMVKFYLFSCFCIFLMDSVFSSSSQNEKFSNSYLAASITNNQQNNDGNGTNTELLNKISIILMVFMAFQVITIILIIFLILYIFKRMNRRIDGEPQEFFHFSEV